jgi:DMSO/TMAO reductase YedYZ heme-binding membrane subunit
MNEQLWWYAARASGLVGWGLCTLSVLWGLTLSTRLLGKRAAPAWLLDLHRFLGGLATFFVAVHLGALVADGFVPFGPAELLVPLASAWKPGPVAWGIAAFYLLVAVEVTSLARRRLPVRIWRMVHMTSLPLWAVSTVHLVTAGTDIRNPLVQWAVLASTGAVLFTTLVRILSPRPRRAVLQGAHQVAPGAPGRGHGPDHLGQADPVETVGLPSSRGPAAVQPA